MKIILMCMLSVTFLFVFCLAAFYFRFRLQRRFWSVTFWEDSEYFRSVISSSSHIFQPADSSSYGFKNTRCYTIWFESETDALSALQSYVNDTRLKEEVEQ